MKIIAIGDIHGRNTWKKIIAKEAYDKLIFIGDYFDSKENSSIETQLSCFEAIIDLKTKQDENVILLTGNHDFHYLNHVGEKYGGFQFTHSERINSVLQPAYDTGLLTMCWQYDQFLFSHAGITNTWCSRQRISPHNLTQEINLLFTLALHAFTFVKGTYNGDSPENSPIWVRPPSLRQDMIGSYFQIVGHTSQQTICIEERLALIDTLGYSGEYVIIENGKIRIGQVDPD